MKKKSKNERDSINAIIIVKQKKTDSLSRAADSLGNLMYKNRNDSVVVEKLNKELHKVNYGINQNIAQQQNIEKNLSNPRQCQMPITQSLFLSLWKVNIYSTQATATEASNIDDLFKSYNVQSLSVGSPIGYTIDNVKNTQIVYYNSDQIKFCWLFKNYCKKIIMASFQYVQVLVMVTKRIIAKFI